MAEVASEEHRDVDQVGSINKNEKAGGSDVSTVISPWSSESVTIAGPLHVSAANSSGHPPSDSLKVETGYQSPLSGTQQKPRSYWMRNYQIFILAWSVNSGAAVTSFDLEVFVLRPKVFGIGTALLFLGVIASSLVAGAIINALGPRRGSAYGFMGLVVYLTFLALAAAVGLCSDWQWPLFLLGAGLCGLGVALVGAGLGPMADRTTVAVCKEDPGADYATVSAKVMVIQAIFSNTAECVMMLILTILQVVLHISELWIIVVMAALCFLSAGSVLFSREPPVDDEHEETEAPSIRDGFKLLLRFYKDPRASFLAVYPLALSCMSSWKTAGLTSILKVTLGEQFVGAVMIIQTISTVVFAKLAQLAINRLGNSVVMALGSLACIAGPVLYLLTDLALESWWIVVFYSIVGIAWAVYETACRGLMLDHFRGQMSSIAFASMTMQTFCGGMIFYFLDFIQSPEESSPAFSCGGSPSTQLTSTFQQPVPLEKNPMASAQAVVVLILGLLVMPSVFLANKYKPRQGDDDSHQDPKTQQEQGFDPAESMQDSMA
eukprot:CAMPEP_0206456600 /NCGR_PEP_ID=MMETSP0324_2-20121206/22466_1 /ASSEMBLY_ACC=CAM_ASM_000836 /TAXON_ID=2866 /ORGANISM="Crypthecodinium cohnii, Strain Seligo" /LENGTH=547 /DNA_ID=CAMNT_0053927569 /DNA_START=103 /DNA_END=1746 /DNA_ORIENTATION=+